MDEADLIAQFIAERGITRCPPKRASAPGVKKEALAAFRAREIERRRAALQASAIEAADKG